MTRPKKQHYSVRYHKCNQCDYVSSWADVVKSHVIAHSREKSHKCNKCESLFFHASTLVHMKIHCGDKDFKSNNCEHTLVLAKNSQVGQRVKKMHIMNIFCQVHSHWLHLKCNQCELWIYWHLALFNMPNSNWYDILLISIFCKTPFKG